MSGGLGDHASGEFFGFPAGARLGWQGPRGGSRVRPYPPWGDVVRLYSLRGGTLTSARFDDVVVL